tara:strand:- start:15466 stop:17775 length:2310 start_codon:yes stop_codon:yes gene_type:complete
MSDMNLSLIIRLLDQFSQPAKRLRDTAKAVATDMRAGFASAFREGFSVANVEASIANAEGALGRARGRLMGALSMGAAIAAPIINLGKFESQLVAFGNTAGIFGDDLKAIDAELRAMGPSVNKSASDMLGALEYLVGKGLSPEQGLAALRSVGMTATATGAEINDMAAAGFAAMDNLKVPADQLQLAFDAMAQSGKSGGFELKAMATYFPELTASARMLGMDGVNAVAEIGAALQVAMKGTGSESTAANNMQNFLSKLTAPETVKRFKDQGVDIREEFAKAEADGVSVFDHMLTLIDQMADGDQFKIGELFGDQQVGNFLKPMIADLEEFRRIRGEAMGANGVNANDFSRVMDTMEQRAKAVVIQLDNVTTSGSVLLDIAKDLATQIGSSVAAVNAFAQANPELTRTMVLVAAGMMTLSIATRLASWAFWGLILPVRRLSGFFLKFDDVGKNVATGWRLLAGAGGLLSGAFNIIVAAAGAVVTGLGAISAPVWGIIAVLVAAGFALWKYWDRISSFVSGMAEGLGGLLSPAIDAVKGAIDGLIDKLGEMLGFDQAQMDAFKTAIGDGIAAALNFGPMIDGAKELLGNFWTWLGGFFSQETLSDSEKGEMRNAGRKLIEDMWNGIKEKFVEVIEWFRNLPQMLAAEIGQIDLTGLIKFPDVGAWWNGMTGGQQQATDGALGSAEGSSQSFGDPITASSFETMYPDLPQQVQANINASVTDKRPPQVSVTVQAPITITGVIDPRAAANQAAGQLSNAVSQATSGALHDGME